ncbi:MAG: Xaa-Pro peptidase family protein [Nitrospinota bacterium]|jgi:Xaa-Pro dipeptidase|nr:Xaa-Pro peptidase family protein [Nitrospinota bacterium]MDP7166154.1 Xaa-Pro peptidase family protein [Nitrospinota bacterium]MDP7369175.1 Xaa-Pro peptidase family protein [Nitrospinota bacterium]MDP7664690.1 Xaa-Pro peptidase family protein [Nitrospinota bacterium]
MTFGLMAKDCEIRVDYDKLRKDRLRKTNEQMKQDGIAVLLCFDPDWIRYITSTKANDWANNKLLRSVLFAADREPILYELGSAIEAKKELCPWIADRMHPSIGTWRGAFPREVVTENALKFAKMVKAHLKELGLENEPLGLDITEIPILQSLEAEGVTVVDGQQTLLEASKIKTPEEVELIETSISIVEAAFWEVVNTAKPGVRELDIAAMMRDVMYRYGAEEMQNINVISGNRSHPHPHDFSDRMLRMGDMLFIDVVSVFNGYKTCYYQTFCIGKPSKKQLDVYRQTYEWLFAAIDLVKPGVSTADIAAVWPSAEELGLSGEAEAFALQVGHGIGITHWGKPVISRFFSFDHPEIIEEGMVLAFETYCGHGNDGARIEEQFVVTESGVRMLSKFPSRDLIACPCVGSLLP